MDYYDLKADKAFMVSQKALIAKGDKWLVLKFPDKLGKLWSNKWGLPGGLLEMEEDFAEGLIREVKEEAGVMIKVEKVMGIGEVSYDGFIFKDGRKLNVRIIEIGFMCTHAAGEVKLSEEHVEHRWVTKEEMAELDFSPDSNQLVEQFLRN